PEYRERISWREGRRSAAGSHKFSVERDLGVENLGHRTVFFRFASHLCECRLTQIGHIRAQRQSGPRDTKSLSLGFEADGCLGTQFGRREAGALQLEGESHRKTPRMGRGDKLLWVRTFLVLEAGSERIGGLCEDP